MGRGETVSKLDWSKAKLSRGQSFIRVKTVGEVLEERRRKDRQGRRKGEISKQKKSKPKVTRVIVRKKGQKSGIWKPTTPSTLSQVPCSKPKKPTPSFYETPRWLGLRYQVLKNHNGVCSLCGMTRKDGKKLHVDHIKPRSSHPWLQYELKNLQVLCADCNLGKSNKDDTDWR